MANQSIYSAFERMWQHVTAADGKKQDKLTFDNAPIKNSEKPVTSDGIKTALDAKQDKLTIDSTPTSGSTNPVTSGGVKAELDKKANATELETKQDKLTFDNTPTANSSNPVTSSGIKSYVDGRAYSHPSSHPASMITGLATVATSGSYNDLTNKPTIPAAVTVDTALSDTSTNPVQNKVVKAELDKKADATELESKADLDSSGKVPSSQLPSYVDDVIEGSYVSSTSFKDTSGTAISGETGKIYVDTATNKTYRWSGSAFVEISASLALGETSSTAYRGDRGKIAYDHSQAAHAPSDAQKNQNAFSNIAVSGQTTVAADTATDTLTLVAGSNITITTDATNDKVTIAATDTVYSHPSSHPASMITGLATVATSGSYNDLSNKPTIPAAYSHPSSHPASMITGLATVATSGSYNDLTNKPTIPAAVTVDTALSDTSTNPVQNKVVKAALDAKLGIENPEVTGELSIPNSDAGWYGCPGVHITSSEIRFDENTIGEYSGIITGLADPTSDSHAATKGYVDNLHKGVTTAGSGSAYTATVTGIATLTTGASFIMIPHTASTTKTPTLNVNGLGAKSLKRQTSNVSGTLANGYADSWLGANIPVQVIYNGTYWVVQGMTQCNPHDLSTAVPVTKGGTGVTSLEALASSLRSYLYTYGTEDLVAGESDLETGKIYFVYE